MAGWASPGLISGDSHCRLNVEPRASAARDFGTYFALGNPAGMKACDSSGRRQGAM